MGEDREALKVSQLVLNWDEATQVGTCNACGERVEETGHDVDEMTGFGNEVIRRWTTRTRFLPCGHWSEPEPYR